MSKREYVEIDGNVFPAIRVSKDPYQWFVSRSVARKIVKLLCPKCAQLPRPGWRLLLGRLSNGEMLSSGKRSISNEQGKFVITLTDCNVHNKRPRKAGDL